MTPVRQEYIFTRTSTRTRTRTAKHNQYLALALLYHSHNYCFGCPISSNCRSCSLEGWLSHESIVGPGA